LVRARTIAAARAGMRLGKQRVAIAIDPNHRTRDEYTADSTPSEAPDPVVRIPNARYPGRTLTMRDASAMQPLTPDRLHRPDLLEAPDAAAIFE